MTNFKILLTVLLLVPILSFSQANLSKDFDISVGTPNKVIDARFKNYVVLDDGHVIMTKTDGDVVFVQKYDGNAMKEVSRTEYKDFPKYSKFQKLLCVKGNVFYIFEAIDKKTKKFSVYSRQINVGTGKFNAAKKLFTTEGPVVAGKALHQKSLMQVGLMGALTNSKPKFDVFTSFDESTVLIAYKRKPLEKDNSINKDVIGCFVFDHTMAKKWGKEVKMLHTEDDMDNLAYYVGSNGSAYMLSFLTKSKKYEVLTVNAQGVTNKELKLKQGSSFNYFKLAETPEGNLLAAGYYANGMEYSWTKGMTLNVNGVYMFAVDKQGSIIWDKEMEFSLDLIQQYVSKGAAKKAAARDKDGKAGINDLVLKELIVNEDGSAIVIGEVYTLLTSTNSYMVTTFKHTYSHIVAVKVNADGTLAWMKKLPKNQYGETVNDINGRTGLSYKFINAGDSYHILYIDNKKNLDLPIDEVPSRHVDGKGGYLITYKINATTGAVEKHLICDLKDVKGNEVKQFSVQRLIRLKDDTFLVEYYAKGKKDNMFKLKLK